VTIDDLELRRPDDWHVHLRDEPMLADLVPATARVFARAIVMPNLRPPVTTVEEARAYRTRILGHVPGGLTFDPLMTLYLTPRTRPEDIEAAAASPEVHAVKLYPAGATTNAEAGVTDLDALSAVFDAMQSCGVPLLVHGESIDPDVDVFDRETVFIRDTLAPLVKRFERLRVVFEHITTTAAVEFVASAPDRVAATITAHHLLYDRNAIFAGGIRPHLYCLPVLKRREHRHALVSAATSGNPKFFLGTDSAPHAREAKESACGCAGLYTAPVALELYAEAFDAVGRLDRLEGFASEFGADFYRLPRNEERIVLHRAEVRVPERVALGATVVVPARAGKTVAWTVLPPGG
jgi:dihydroorotase